MKKVETIGCGAIVTLLARAAERQVLKCNGLILYDYDASHAERLKKSLHIPSAVTKSVDKMIGLQSRVIVEAASQQAVRDYIAKILTAEDIDLIVMSVGALLDLNVTSSKIHVPSGAIGGLDAISGASLAGIDEVVLTTRKSSAALDMDNQEEIMGL